MIKGTTPSLRFILPIETNVIKTAEIVVEYVDANKSVSIVKTMDECILGENYIETKLTQEETLQLPAPSTANIQLRVLTFDGTALATQIQKVTVKRLLKEDVIE